MTEFEHPADAFIEAEVDHILSMTTPEDTLKALGEAAGSIQDAFLNLVNNAPEKALRLSLLRILIDLHERGEDAEVMNIMGFTASAVSLYNPSHVEDFKRENREKYDRLMGGE